MREAAEVAEIQTILCHVLQSSLGTSVPKGLWAPQGHRLNVFSFCIPRIWHKPFIHAGWLAGLVEERIYLKRHFTSGFDMLGLLPININ